MKQPKRLTYEQKCCLSAIIFWIILLSGIVICVLRLFERGKLMNSKIIAVDFDGTLCENNWPEIGEPKFGTIAYLLKEKKQGAKLILWTCRIGEMLEKAVAWCADHSLEFDAINENLTEIIEAFGSDTRKIFANEYLDDRNVLLSVCQEKSNMQLWAEREIEIACKHENLDRKPREWDYDCTCYESALKAFKSLLEDGHSGFSIGMTKYILNRLIEGKTLTPIWDTDDIWDKCTHCKEFDMYQCKRMGSLFKYIYPDGTVKYHDNNRIYCINVDNPNVSYHSGLVSNLIDEMYPIPMPYFPKSKPFIVHCEGFLTNPKNGDFDTVGILYMIKPDGDRVEINRFFKEGEDDFIEIASCEYEMRRKMHKARLKNPKKDCHDCFGASDNSYERCVEERPNE